MGTVSTWPRNEGEMTLLQDPAKSGPTDRIRDLKERMLDEPRYLSIEQALIITDVYKAHERTSSARKRALPLAESDLVKQERARRRRP